MVSQIEVENLNKGVKMLSKMEFFTYIINDESIESEGIGCNYSYAYPLNPDTKPVLTLKIGSNEYEITFLQPQDIVNIDIKKEFEQARSKSCISREKVDENIRQGKVTNHCFNIDKYLEERYGKDSFTINLINK